MRMRRSRMLPAFLGVALSALMSGHAFAQSAPQAPQRRARPLPYHMLLPAAHGRRDGRPRARPHHPTRDPDAARWRPGSDDQPADGVFPYFGQNRVRYDKFDWHIYQTDHFEIYYYPELEPHLERMASVCGERLPAHQRRAEARPGRPRPARPVQDAERVPGEQHHGGETPEGVLAFAEPERNRMVLPIDEPYDQLYALITHELTHIFEFNIIPRGLVGQDLPLWVDEGLADYMTGVLEHAGPDGRCATPRSPTTIPRMSRLTRRRCRAGRPIRSAMPPSSSSSRGGARKGCASSCSRCARACSAAARAPTKKRSRSSRRTSTSSSTAT